MGHKFTEQIKHVSQKAILMCTIENAHRNLLDMEDDE